MYNIVIVHFMKWMSDVRCFLITIWTNLLSAGTFSISTYMKILISISGCDIHKTCTTLLNNLSFCSLYNCCKISRFKWNYYLLYIITFYLYRKRVYVYSSSIRELSLTSFINILLFILINVKYISTEIKSSTYRIVFYLLKCLKTILHFNYTL
jgi:hypothetical protein